MRDNSAPGQVAVNSKSAKPKKSAAKVVNRVEIDLAENGGVTLRVYEKSKDGGETFPFSEAKVYSYSTAPEASDFLAGVMASRSVEGAAAPPAEEPEETTMGALTDEDLEASVGSMMASEAPNTYASVRK